MTRNSQDRYKRLSSALRTNLLKRKEQQRSRQLEPQEKGACMSDDLSENQGQESKAQGFFAEKT